MNRERIRLEEARLKQAPWRKWGPYLSERQWGTVREDYSGNGAAWDSFPHDHARSRAYRWGEDGLAGISDDHQILCFALALWNGRDPIIKERLFGLTNSEGNHGEDCKEYYFYLDSTPTHSYMKYLYKYPQSDYPYGKLVETNRRRSRSESEYELLDTGVFDQDRYFDVFVEYAKASAEDILVRMTIFNRGPASAKLHLLPTIWLRNTWSDGREHDRPLLRVQEEHRNAATIACESSLGSRYLYCDGHPMLLFTENETNRERVFGEPNHTRFVKDGINNYLVHNNKDAVNPERIGTKASANYHLTIGAGESAIVRLRLTDAAPQVQSRSSSRAMFVEFDSVFDARKAEADEFYDGVIPASLNEDQRNVMRQALAGMLWSKQYYYYDLARWLQEHGADPYLGEWRQVRNESWYHMINEDIISMPDKWEYPWFAAWDLAFHTVSLSLVDPDFSRDQINLMLHERYSHPSGQLPAYEWNFSDVNPPVFAWAVLFQYHFSPRGEALDQAWLKYVFHKLVANFTWWVNRKDREGVNIFEGGFLGLDNIGVFDRSAPLPTGGFLEQADGTAWMAFYSLCMQRIAIELALHDPLYEEFVGKFFKHFVWIAHSMNTHIGMWDEEDGFFYDVLRLPNGSAQTLKVRSVVGLLPIGAAAVYEQRVVDGLPRVVEDERRYMQHHPKLLSAIHRPGLKGPNGNYLLSLVDDKRLRRILSKMLDENEFLSPYGIRALSRYHAEHPFVFHVGGRDFRVDYEPAESSTALFGGNSNWRGPIWLPVNVMILRGLYELYRYYGDDFKIECPTGSGRMATLYEVAHEIGGRLQKLFLRDENGRRPVYGATEKFQNDPHWRDHILFYEYFHGDNGAGIGASHQTGWTGLIARIMQVHERIKPEQLLSSEHWKAIRTASEPH
jgi:hypothetical protein